jgi:cytochrome c2
LKQKVEQVSVNQLSDSQAYAMLWVNILKKKRKTGHTARPKADFATLCPILIICIIPAPSMWSQRFMSDFRRLLVVAIAILAAPLSAADTTPDIEHGKATFNTMCGVCHSVQVTGGPIEGPNLVGVVGRPAGSQPDFTKYSPALKASKLIWSTETLDQFLVSPMTMVPGTLMPMLIPDDKTRADVVGYLSTLKKE